MRWEMACTDFGLDALSEEGPRISAMTIWHLPEAYQTQQYPEFELFEEQEFLGFSASLDFRSGGPDAAKLSLTRSWAYEGIKSESDRDFSGSVFLSEKHFSFSFFFPEPQMAALQSSLLAAVAS